MSEDIETSGAPSEDDDVLTFDEGRVLGSLLEKEAITPDNYPLTLNSLVSACNQKSSRDPVVALSADEVEEALEGLRQKHLAVKVHLAGSRAPKYKHSIERVHHLSDPQRALIAILLLRGVQTAGELNQRTERMHAFSSVSAVEEELQALAELPAGALVRVIPAGAGRRTTTYAQLLTGEPDLSPATGSLREDEAAPPGGPATGWRQELEQRVASLEEELAALKQAVDDLQDQLR